MASVPGVKALISTSVLFVCLAVCFRLTSPECYWRATQIFLWSDHHGRPYVRSGKVWGEIKALECESHIWKFGCWTISWLWKFTQLSEELNTPAAASSSSSSEKDLLHCCLGKDYVLPPLTAQTLQSQRWRFMKLLPSWTTVQFSMTYCEMESAAGVTSCRSREFLFCSFTAAHGTPR